MTAGAVAFEPGARAALDLRWGLAAWSSWAFLVLGGSVLAFTIYLRLVRDWGPARAGTYCYVSPVLALLLGAVLMGERMGVPELLGTAAMLLAARPALRPPVVADRRQGTVLNPREARLPRTRFRL